MGGVQEALPSSRLFADARIQGQIGESERAQGAVQCDFRRHLWP